jgi:hypothetical protein
MKSIIRVLLVALALGATGAYAQSASDSTAAKYDSQSTSGNSANWGVGG